MNTNAWFSKTIGIWISDKKSQKLNWKELIKSSSARGYNLIKIDIDKPLEQQRDIDVFLHKLTDIIAASDHGDPNATIIIKRIEQYLSNHPHITVIDPLDNVRILLNRYRYYTILQEESSLKNNGIFTPAFAEFTTNDLEQNLNIMKWRNVKFPVICKPTLAHGSKFAHKMVLIFNKKGLRECKPPCVVQSFVNHDAVLHKVFLTGEVCKADSQSTLSILDPHDKADIRLTLDEEKVKCVIKVLMKKIGLLLAGFDVVIDNVTGNHAVIDINVFPSYDSFPNFYEHLLDCIEENISIGSNDCVSLGNKHTLNGLINVGDSNVPCRNVNYYES
ncbi:unnamed protein product [Leptidea sinapis]|uniref:Inositol-tetrakisphosphate 1-kinase n=1 Tax=Leptidea sinapis TaxID=189913 RepID=A0A5E4QBI5_9NEOP|nr:unnamed protein product [Leptidea sinapis]